MVLAAGLQEPKPKPNVISATAKEVVPLMLTTSDPAQTLTVHWVYCEGETDNLKNLLGQGTPSPKIKGGEYVLVYVTDAEKAGIKIPANTGAPK